MIEVSHYCDDCKAKQAQASDLVSVEVRASGLKSCVPSCVRVDNDSHEEHRTHLVTVHLCLTTCAAKAHTVTELLALARQ